MSGLTPIEGYVMGLWDNGLSVAAIARQIAMPLRKLHKIVAHYHVDHEHRDHRRKITAGSQRLALAIAETGSLHQ